MLMFSPRWTIALPLLLLIPVAIRWRSRLNYRVLALSVVVVGGPVTGFNIPGKKIAGTPPAGKPFRVMTINMHYSRLDPTELESLIAGERPDVVAIQEWPGSAKSSWASAADWHVHDTHGLFLASRHPIQQVVELGDNSMGGQASAARYELDTPFGLVHVISMHTASSRKGISDTMHDYQKGPTELRANSALRREQAVYLAGKAAACTGPVLVVGDMNTPPESSIFRVRSAADRFIECGKRQPGDYFVGSSVTS